MKVLQIIDYQGWAIGKLATVIRKYNPQINFRVLEIHPKDLIRNPEFYIKMVKENLEWANMIDFQYWNTALNLINLMPDELKNKKKILTHQNQKNLLSGDWSSFDLIICHTEKAKKILVEEGNYRNVEIFPFGIDLNYFKFIENYPINNEKIVGYVGRIVPWKNLAEIAKACYELGYKLAIMGRMDKPSYWESMPEEHRDIIDLSFFEAKDEERYDFYKLISLYVGYSSDGREEGTLPLLEAMACGVPIISTPSGMGADLLIDGQNAIITPFDNYEALKNNLKILMENEELRQSLRKNAWGSIKNYPEEKMSWNYQCIFNEVFNFLNPLVSIILPIFNNKNNLEKILERLKEMEYKNFEIIICDDGSCDDCFSLIDNFRKNNEDMILKYFKIDYPENINQKPYGLARARNLGIIESVGEYLMFLDSRLLPNKYAINAFLNCYEREEDKEENKKIWLFGEKGGQKKTFVENFSFIKRRDIINAGMFCESIRQYGGLTQEIRSRLQRQSFNFIYCEEAITSELNKSSLNEKRRLDIIKSKFLLYKMGFK